MDCDFGGCQSCGLKQTHPSVRSSLPNTKLLSSPHLTLPPASPSMKHPTIGACCSPSPRIAFKNSTNATTLVLRLSIKPAKSRSKVDRITSDSP